MLVKKFEADTLEEALKAVKFELGPDAIILKTITNKGLKGAFKKKRIEITAAISEKSLHKKEQSYKNSHTDSSSYAPTPRKINESVDVRTDSYGQLGLNRVVNTVQKRNESSGFSAKLKHSLDDFLKESDENIDFETDNDLAWPSENKKDDSYHRNAQVANVNNQSVVNKELLSELKSQFRQQEKKIEILERRLHELSQIKPAQEISDFRGLYELRQSLRVLDIREDHIQEVIKKINEVLDEKDLENTELVFETALKKISELIKTDFPLFAKVSNNQPVLTVLISETASGQTTMGMKIAVLKKDVHYIQFSHDAVNSSSMDFASQVFKIPVEKTQNLAEVVSLTRKLNQQGKSVLIDLHLSSTNSDESKKFIEAIKRGFDNVEVLCNLSAIHSEIYNRKIISRYRDISDGVIISFVDICSSFGALYNIHRSFPELSLKFFGTGPVVPDDLEAASSERLLAGLFQL